MVGSALAPSTSKTYLSAFKSWTEFCSLPGIRADPFAPTEESLVFYAAWAASRENPLAHGTAQRYLYGIRSVLLSQGITFPSFHDMPLLERAMKGWKKATYAKSLKPRLPITIAILKQMMEQVSFTLRNDRMIWAVLCTGIYGLFRSGELAPQSAKAKDYLRMRDLHRDAGGRYRIHLGASKTDIWRIGVDVHITGNGTSTCPIRALDAMLKDRGNTDPNAPLFSLDGVKPLTRPQLLKAMKMLLARAKLDPTKFSGHSLRKGGAQTLMEAGVPEWQIQILGRWQSACFKLYVQLTEDIRKHIAVLMGKAKSSPLKP